MNECLRERLVQTIGVGRVTGYTASGSPTGSTVSDVLAYVERKASRVPQAGGTEKVTSHLIITEAELRLDDSIWLPGVARTSANRRTPAAVDAFFDPITGALDHYETRI
jgi:hypothetical protein